MLKRRPATFSVVALLAGGAAVVLTCLLCWAGGLPGFGSNSVIDNAEISEPPVITPDAQDDGAPPEPPLAAETASRQENGPEDAALQNAATPPVAEPLSPLSSSDAKADEAVTVSPDANARAEKQAAQAQPAVLPQDSHGSATPETAAPDSAAVSSGHNSGIKLFDTIEFKRPLSSLPGWLDLLRRNKLDPIFIPGKYFKKDVTWDNFRAKAPTKNTMELLRYVNAFWNTWPYKEDITNWGVEDYWEIPAEFLKKSGDCEDYAIIKYFTLKELGVPPETMRIVVVRDTIRNLAHAVLAVYLNNDAYILDNLSNAVLSHTRLRQYSPQYSVNESGRWAHLKGRKIR